VCDGALQLTHLLAGALAGLLGAQHKCFGHGPPRRIQRLPPTIRLHVLPARNLNLPANHKKQSSSHAELMAVSLCVADLTVWKFQSCSANWWPAAQ
jgi:hypothetical protein